MHIILWIKNYLDDYAVWAGQAVVSFFKFYFVLHCFRFSFLF